MAATCVSARALVRRPMAAAAALLSSPEPEMQAVVFLSSVDRVLAKQAGILVSRSGTGVARILAASKYKEGALRLRLLLEE